MTALGLTIPDVAAATDAKQTAIYAWRSGEYQPRRDKFADLARVLECDVSEIALAAAGIASPEASAPTEA